MVWHMLSFDVWIG